MIGLRTVRRSDLPTLLELNQGELECVGSLDEGKLERLVAMAEQTLIADDDGIIAGFIVTIGSRSPYDSLNYSWFEERYAAHRYVDRIIVARSHRRQGIASILYAAVEADLPVTLEVYAEPPNEPSLAFHRSRGYEEVGRLPQDNGKTAAMFAKQPDTSKMDIPG